MLLPVELHPNPGPGVPSSRTVSHSAGASLNALQITFNKLTESLGALSIFSPFTTNVGDPPTEYSSFSSLWILNKG